VPRDLIAVAVKLSEVGERSDACVELARQTVLGNGQKLEMGQREDLFGQRALDVVVREVQRGERVGDVGDSLEGVDFVVGEVDDFNVRGEFVFVEDEVYFVPAGVGDHVFGEVDFGEVG